jgi:hypothetical protein
VVATFDRESADEAVLAGSSRLSPKPPIATATPCQCRRLGTMEPSDLREKYQDSRVEDGVFGAGISHRMSLPYRSNSQARSFARRLELNPVT